jgi:hypothetical protein
MPMRKNMSIFWDPGGRSFSDMRIRAFYASSKKGNDIRCTHGSRGEARDNRLSLDSIHPEDAPGEFGDRGNHERRKISARVH